MTDIYSIDQYLIHTVDIVHVTISRGDRTTSTEEDIPAFITEKREVSRNVQGDERSGSVVSFRSTVIFLKPDQTITLQDEVVVNEITRPVLRIELPRDTVGVRFKKVFV